MSRIVVALGGNALGNSPLEQRELAGRTAKAIAGIIENHHEVIVTHGNGPQVGMISMAFELAQKAESRMPSMPFPECGALSQGYIGYHLQNALQEEFLRRNIRSSCAAVITQVLVDENDPVFLNPTKPIGPFYSREEAEMLAKTRGYIMKEDAGRGYRRVVASPKPIGVPEADIIRTLVEAGHIVIAVGGGGIPVIRIGQSLVGVPAVIDKDMASAKLAQILDADYLFILTAVDKVSLNFGKPDQKDLDLLSVSDAKKYMEAGHFAKGSMLPKVEAACGFVESGRGKQAVIASLENAEKALQGKAGTKIIF